MTILVSRLETKIHGLQEVKNVADAAFCVFCFLNGVYSR